MDFKAKVIVFGAIGLLNIFSSCSSFALTPSKADLKAVEDKVLLQSMEHKKLQAQAVQINLELTSVSKDMIRTARQIQNSEEKLSRMERQLKILKSELEKSQQKFDLEDKNLIKTLAALQNLALKPTESLLVQPLGPVDVIRSALVLRETIPYLEENAETIRQQLLDVSTKKHNIEKQIKEISKQKNVMKAEHEQMIRLIQRKSKLRNRVDIKSKETKQNIDKLASKARDIRDLLNNIEKQRKKQAMLAEKRRKEAEAKRKQEEKQSSSLISSKIPSINDLATGFSQAKGKLPLPARGEIVVRYGQKNAKETSKGITIATRTRAQVISSFDGAVVFAGPFRGYGNMIIIEHGEGYLSLLAGLGSIDVELGQMLLAGEPVGQMGADLDNKLYVEIRKENQPINPSAWFKI